MIHEFPSETPKSTVFAEVKDYLAGLGFRTTHMDD